MKKLLFIFLLPAVMISCNNENSTEPAKSTPVIIEESDTANQLNGADTLTRKDTAASKQAAKNKNSKKAKSRKA